MPGGDLICRQAKQEEEDHGLQVSIQRRSSSRSGEPRRHQYRPPAPQAQASPPSASSDDDQLTEKLKHPLSAGGPAKKPGRLHAFLRPSDEEGGIVAAAPAIPPLALARRFWPFARPYRRMIAAGLLLVALLPLVQAVEIWLFKEVVDDVIVAGALDALPWLAGAVVGLTLLGALLSFAEDYAWTSAGERFLLDLRGAFFSHVQKLSLDTLDRRRLGDLIARISGDVQAIEGFVLGGLGEGISALARIVIFTGALFLLDWQLALTVLVLAPPFYFSTRYFARLARHAAREKRRRSGALSAVAEESLANAALVQSTDQGDAERRRFVREGEGVVDAELASARIGGAFSGLTALVEVAGVLLVVALGTWAIDDGRLTVGGLLAFLAYVTQLLRPVSDLGHLASTLLAASAGGERVLELLDRRADVNDRSDARPLPATLAGEIELDDVDYTYPGSAEPALRDVSLRIAPGEVVALVGPSGGGKSTLARLLLRFCDPDAGAVLVDGHDLRSVTLASLRANVGTLLQETMLFDASVRENIAFGAPGAAHEEIVAAARAASAHEFIETLPDGYSTRVGQRGRSLSGGQRRRVEVARTLLRDSRVLILDEPTTGLDADSAAELIPALRDLLDGRTAVVITHEPELVLAADRVIEVNGGRCRERTAVPSS